MWDKIKKLLKDVFTWFSKYGKVIATISLGILGVIAGAIAWKRIKVIIDKLSEDTPPIHWTPVDTHKIAIQVPGSSDVKVIALPDNQTSDKVTSVGYDAGKEIVVVEVQHETIDRRNVRPIPNSAYDVLTGKDK